MKKKHEKKKKRSTSLGKLMAVTWIDHSSRQGWHTPGEIPTDIVAHTYGRVVGEDKKYLHIACNECEVDGLIGIVMSVVKSCIVKKKVLK